MKHLYKLAALTVAILFVPQASALGTVKPPCDNGTLFRRVNVLVCIPNKTDKGLPAITRRSNRQSVYVQQRSVRSHVRALVIKPPVNKPFVTRVSDVRSSRARRAAAFANFRTDTGKTAYIKRLKEEQKSFSDKRK